jgi:hypothetical protein
MGGGGKNTTSNTSVVTVPEWLESAARQNLARADKLAQIGYTPYYGPDVAAMTPMQMAAMQGTNTAASAFGMPTADPMAGMPAATNYGGMPAYSSGGLYDQALAELERRFPGQYAALRAPFIDPVTGARPRSPFGSGGGIGSGSIATSPGMFGVIPAVQMRDGPGRDTYGAPSAQASRSGTGSFGLPDPMSGSISGVSRNVADAVSGAFGRTPIGMAVGFLGDVMGSGTKGGKSGGSGGSSSGSSGASAGKSGEFRR